MALFIRNQKLYEQTQRKLDSIYKQADPLFKRSSEFNDMAALKKGQMLEKKADKLYASTYTKIYGFKNNETGKFFGYKVR